MYTSHKHLINSQFSHPYSLTCYLSPTKMLHPKYLSLKISNCLLCNKLTPATFSNTLPSLDNPHPSYHITQRLPSISTITIATTLKHIIQQTYHYPVTIQSAVASITTFLNKLIVYLVIMGMVVMMMVMVVGVHWWLMLKKQDCGRCARVWRWSRITSVGEMGLDRCGWARKAFW